MTGLVWMLSLAAASGELAPAGPDRSTPPAVRPPSSLPLPGPEIHELGPGRVVWHVRVPSVRKVAVHLVFGRGLVELDGSPSETSQATGWLLDVAGGAHGSAELSELADLHQVDLRSRIGLHDGAVSMVAPVTELDIGLDLLEAIVTGPRFPARDLRRHVQDLQQYYTLDVPASQDGLAAATLGYAWFAPDHPYGTRPNLEELAAIKRRDVRSRWERWSESAPVTVVVVGDVPWSRVEAPLRRILAPVGADAPRATGLKVPVPPAGVVAVAMPGQDQVAIRLRMAAPPQDHADHVAVWTAQWALGGHFLSRLNRVLREERDYTYGARADYRYGDTWGTFTVSVSVAAENLAETVDVIRAEIDAMATAGLTPGEIDGARLSALQDWNVTLQSAERASRLYLDLLDRGWSLDRARGLPDAIGAVRPDDGARVATTWWGPSTARVWVVVGDRVKVEKELVDAGLDAVWLSPTEAALGDFVNDSGRNDG